MSEQITAKVKVDLADLSKTLVIIRKVLIDDAEHRVIAIYGLTASGEWVKIAEGQPYPESCRLPIDIWEKSDILDF